VCVFVDEDMHSSLALQILAAITTTFFFCNKTVYLRKRDLHAVITGVQVL